ncbi:hypothetical protein [Halorhabdus amylolytica]|uniref:hypothetical protein n=1 Tax=Halorhabdus amylolytica TaxID=2559573 RepID=UPI0010A9A976|nr:hypothetical protein [Halorhabdus amylolytica]
MTRDDRPSKGDDLWLTLREPATIFDLVLLGAVPATLLGTMALPQATRTALAFEYTDPSIGTAFVSSFVHATETHAAVNLVGYTLVVALAYVLSVLSGRRRRFRVTFVSLVLASPILLSYLNLTIVRRSAAIGFSGVLMALYGYLPLALGAFLQEQLDLGDSRRTGPLLFFVGLSLITVLTLGAVLTNPVTVPVRGVTVPVTSVLAGTLLSLFLALTLVVTLYVLSVTDGERNARSVASAALSRSGRAELTVVALVTFLAVPFVTFPLDPVVNGGVLNLYSHLVGYGLGFIATYVTATVEDRLFDTVE